MINMCRFLLILVFTWLCAESAYPTPQEGDIPSVRPKVALVLSGGGARGAAHVGVIRLIEELHIPIDYVVGTSMGAIIGGLYAIGYSADEMDSLLMVQDWKVLLSNDTPRRQQPYVQRMARKQYQINIPYDRGRLTENSTYYRDAGIKVRRSSLQTFPKVLARPGLIDGHNLMNKFEQLTAHYAGTIAYDTLPCAFACVATDLVTGREVVFRHGRIAESMRASMSIPGVFYPVYTGEAVLVDGGVVNNYPVNVARAMGADIVIGVEVNSSTIEASELHAFTSIFERLIGTLGSDLHERNVDDTDILIQPRVKQFPVMGFDSINLRQLIDIGYATALETKVALETIGTTTPHEQKRPMHMESSSPQSECNMADASDTENKVPHSTSLTNHVSLGLRLDSEEGAAALLRVGMSRREESVKMGLTARLSFSPWGIAHLAYAWHDGPQVNMEGRYRFAEVNSSNEGGSHAFSYHYYGSDIYLSDLLSYDYDLRIGARYDYSMLRGLHYRTSDTYGNASTRRSYSYTTLYIRARNDLFNSAYFPSEGYAYDVEVAYNIKNRNRAGGNFWSIQSDISVAIPLSNSTVLQPMLYGRYLPGDEAPLIYANAIGGSLPERYLRQQVPFVGITGTEFMERNLSIFRVGLRQRLCPDIYLSGIVNYAYSTDHLTEADSGCSVWGIGLQLAYDTTIGPLTLCGDWNDRNHRFGGYFSFGFEF